MASEENGILVTLLGNRILKLIGKPVSKSKYVCVRGI